MFKLIKFAVFLSITVVAGYFVLGLPFGDKTLYQHLVTISETREAQALKDEIGRKVDDATTDITKKAKNLAIEKVQDELKTVREKKAAEAAKAAKEDGLTLSDKTALDALIQDKQQNEQLTADRHSLNALIRAKNKE